MTTAATKKQQIQPLATTRTDIRTSTAYTTTTSPTTTINNNYHNNSITTYINDGIQNNM